MGKQWKIHPKNERKRKILEMHYHFPRDTMIMGGRVNWKIALNFGKESKFQRDGFFQGAKLQRSFRPRCNLSQIYLLGWWNTFSHMTPEIGHLKRKFIGSNFFRISEGLSQSKGLLFFLEEIQRSPPWATSTQLGGFLTTSLSFCCMCCSNSNSNILVITINTDKKKKNRNNNSNNE